MPTVSSFGRTRDGADAQLFTLRNAHGLTAAISNYGGTLASLQVPDKDGQLGEIVLGFADVSGYQSPEFLKAGPYFGALIGRYGNRIAQGKFSLNGHDYQLAINNPPNALHGGRQGFDKVLWQAEPGRSAAGQTLTLRYQSADGEEGYPGTLQVQVVYTLADDNTLSLNYTATTDQPTVLNLTNHSYFNLAHGQQADVLQHEVQLFADRYTVVDDSQIPTGELRSVAGTPFDFRQLHTIGARIGEVPGGYDHNWVLTGDGLRRAACVREPTTGRTLEVLTTQPGVQFYTGNFLDGSLRGHGNVVYGPHAGFCLETQHFPDSPNQPTFPSTVLQPGQTYQHRTVFRFGVQL